MTPDYETLFNNRGDAEKVLDGMREILRMYGVVTVADLRALSHLCVDYTDTKYGWSSLHGAYIALGRYCYKLALPMPLPIEPDDKKSENKMIEAVQAIERGLLDSGLNWSVSYNHETKSYHVYISEPEEDTNG